MNEMKEVKKKKMYKAYILFDICSKLNPIYINTHIYVYIFMYIYTYLSSSSSSPLCNARGKPLGADNAHPFPLLLYAYFRHYRTFHVAINSFPVALKFLKGILDIYFTSLSFFLIFSHTHTVFLTVSFLLFRH